MVTEHEQGVVVVTGTSSGIGRAVASQLASRGLRVIGLDRRRGAPGGVEERLVDLADPDSIEEGFADLPVVDRLISCAGVTGAAGPEVTLRVNVLGLRNVTDRAVDRMPEGGSVTHVASVGGWKWELHFDRVRDFLAHVGPEDLSAWCRQNADLVSPSAYPFSKQCVVVETLVRSAALAPRRIRVNATSPGLVDTPMVGSESVVGPRFVPEFPLPFGRMTTAEEQAAVLTTLSGPESSPISGAIVPTDHGLLASVRVGALASPFVDA